MKFHHPYVVVRYMPAVYGRELILINGYFGGFHINEVSYNIEDEQYAEMGKLGKDSLEKLILVIKDKIRADGFRRCLVVSPNEAFYCEPDGRVNFSKNVPAGGISMKFDVSGISNT